MMYKFIKPFIDFQPYIRISPIFTSYFANLKLYYITGQCKFLKLIIFQYSNKITKTVHKNL